MVEFKYIWGREPFVYFFNAIHTWLSTSFNVVLYSCFNYNNDDIVSNIKYLDPKQRKKYMKVYYTGERFLDDCDSQITIGFLPNNYKFIELNKMSDSLIRNLNYEYDNDIESRDIKIIKIDILNNYNYNFNTLSKYNTKNKDKIYIQLRDQERTEIEYLLKKQLQIEQKPIYSSVKFNQKYLEDLSIYSDINHIWKNMHNKLVKQPFKFHENKPYFCCFIVSNPNCVQRNMFYDLLKKYKGIQSCGAHMKNVSFVIPDRINEQEEYIKFISKFKFMITFENHSLEYYHTEKIFNAFKAGTVPIYWGDPLINKVYTEDCFINIPSRSSQTNQPFTLVEQYKELEIAVKKVIYYDNNQNEYLKLFEKPCILNARKEDIKIKNNIKVIENIPYLLLR